MLSIQTRVRGAIADYEKAKGEPLDSNTIGFLRRNKICDKTVGEIDALIESAKKLSGGKLIGDGDKFKAFCVRFNRTHPTKVMIDLLNSDPQAGREMIRNDYNHPLIYRALCSFLTGKGNKS